MRRVQRLFCSIYTKKCFLFLVTDLQEADQGRMQQQLWAMCYGLWTRTGCRGADEAKPQHEESEGLEEDVQVVVPGSEHDIV